MTMLDGENTFEWCWKNSWSDSFVLWNKKILAFNFNLTCRTILTLLYTHRRHLPRSSTCGWAESGTQIDIGGQWLVDAQSFAGPRRAAQGTVLQRADAG